MDSFSVPDQLAPSETAFLTNCAIRGGIIQTRPGSISYPCLPDGNLQGGRIFTPASGVAHAVVVIDGLVYVMPAPFNGTWRQLAGLQFNPSSRFIAWASCLQTTDFSDNGTLFPLEEPRRILVFGDGRTREAYWDGATHRHLNPTATRTTLTTPGNDETRIGLWRVWSNNRLWIFQGNKGYASDLGNPLKFTEAQYVNELPFFPLPAACTGAIETPDKEGILVFYEKGCDVIRTSLQDRASWLQPENSNMQRTIFEVGCVAPRSLIKKNGMVFWFSPAGLVNADEAARSFVTSKLDTMDQEMAWSKAYIGPDLQGICGTYHENQLVLSTPFCSLDNTHTWALDEAVFENRAAAWNGIWTGWRPVEWSTEVVGGRERVFFFSRDYDNHNRMWEAFLPDRRDNGCDITCSAQFRLDNLDTESLKRFGHYEADVVQVQGDVSAMLSIAGWRGWFDRLATKEIAANRGRVFGQQTYGNGQQFPKLGGNRPQVRTIRSGQWSRPSDCNSCGTESQRDNNIDRAFQPWIGWSGWMAVAGLRMFATEESEQTVGSCETDESQDENRVLMAEGCAATEAFPTKEAYPLLTATQQYELAGISNRATRILARATATSRISQADASRKALCHATRQAVAIALDPAITHSSETTTDTMYVLVIHPGEEIPEPLGIAELTVYLEDGVTIVGESLNLITVFQGMEPADRVLILRNTGTADLILGTVSITGSGYTLESDPSGTTLTPGQSINLIFRAVVV